MIDVKTPKTPSKIRDLCEGIAEKYRSGVITFAQFETELGYVTLEPESFEDFHPSLLPVRPEIMRGYELLSPEGKARLGANDPDVKEYYRALSKAENENKSKMLALEDLIRVLPLWDIKNITKIRERMHEFNGTEIKPYRNNDNERDRQVPRYSRNDSMETV